MTQYEIVAAHALPRFDPSKTVKLVVFSPSNAACVTRAIRQVQGLVTVCYFTGAALFPVMLLTRAEIATYLAVVEAIVEFPVYFTAFMSLSVDLVQLIVTSFDYWFLSTTTVIFSISFSLLVQDWRIVLFASRWLGFQIPILIDANISQRRSLVHALVLNMALILLAIVVVALDAVDHTASVILVISPHRSLSTRDLLMNAIVTMEVVLLRIVLRKYELMKRPPKATVGDNDRAETLSPFVTITCVTIRCTIKLQEVIGEGPNAGCTSPVSPVAQDRHCIQLRPTVSSERYDSALMVAPRLIPRVWHPTSRLVLHAIGSAGLCLTVLCCWADSFSSLDRVIVADVAICAGATVFTTTFVGTYGLSYNRRLLRRLCRSFDFVFLSLQITTAHLCLCDMLYWRLSPTVTLLNSWLWIHWVLTLDALTPDTKAQLGFRPHFEMLVLVLYIAGEVAACSAAVLWDLWAVQNRVIVSATLWNHKLAFTMVPFITSRLLTTSVWTLRLLWRVCRDPDPTKLILLRGQVEFELERRARNTSTLTSVVPFVDPSFKAQRGGLRSLK